jgi:hypothetical protein
MCDGPCAPSGHTELLVKATSWAASPPCLARQLACSCQMFQRLCRPSMMPASVHDAQDNAGGAQEQACYKAFGFQTRARCTDECWGCCCWQRLPLLLACRHPTSCRRGRRLCGAGQSSVCRDALMVSLPLSVRLGSPAAAECCKFECSCTWNPCTCCCCD